MILALLFLAGGIALLVLAWRSLARARGGDWVRAADTRLVVEAAPGKDAPQLRLESGGTALFGPLKADWAPPPDLSQALGNPEAVPGRAGGAVMPGTYRTLAMLDLSAPDVIATGTTALDEPLRKSLGSQVLLLEPASEGRPPLLLHGRQNRIRGSLGGIAVDGNRLAALAAKTGDPKGLQVEIIRRRIRRDGWGPASETRRRRLT